MTEITKDTKLGNVRCRGGHACQVVALAKTGRPRSSYK